MGYLPRRPPLADARRARRRPTSSSSRIFVNPLQFGAQRGSRPPTRATSPATSRVCEAEGVDVRVRADASPRCTRAAAAHDACTSPSSPRTCAARRGRRTSTASPPSSRSCSRSSGRARRSSGARTRSSSRSSRAWPTTSNLPVEVVGCPIVREPDGARDVESQRVPDGRPSASAALVLSRALRDAVDAVVAR